MSEIYGSGGHDSGDDGASHTDRGTGSFGSGWGEEMTRGEYADHAHDQPPDADPEDPDDDISAILHEDDHLPEPRTRQEVAREAAAWDQAPTLAPAGAEAGDAKRGEHPYSIAENVDAGELARQEVGDGAADQSAETGDIWRQRIAELEAASTELGKAVSELETENAELRRGITEVKSQNAELKLANEELRHGMSALDARLQGVEQKTDDAALAAMCGSRQDAYAIAEESQQRQPERPEWTSNEAIGLAVAVGGGIMTTAADYWSALPASYAGIAASALGIGAATMSYYRKHREIKDAHRPKH